MATVLVIDDDRAFCDYLEILLRRAGHRPRALARAADLEAMIGAGDVDAVITDLYMPEVDGIEVIRAIKRLAPTLPVICVSGSHPGADDPCLKVARLLGADAVLSKPMPPGELLDALHRLLPTVH